MYNNLKDAKNIEHLATAMKGVFTTFDLQTIIAPKQANNFLLRVRALEEANILQRFVRGIYITPQFDLATLSQRICPESYISQANVLSKELIIGTEPGDTVVAIKKGKRREYKSPQGIITHLGIAPSLYFGFKTIDGVNWADKEKALLDCLYYYQKGQKFYFNLFSDVNIETINTKRLKSYLKKYKNPKFVKFVEGYINENSPAK